MKKKVGDWICYKCGASLGKVFKNHLPTWHSGKCDYCGKNNISVTQPRDFGYPELPVL
jgi:ribosomal protein S27AE